MTRLASLLAAIGLTTFGVACGSPHRAASTAHVYSVAQVTRAFAGLGLQLHREAPPGPGLVALVNDRRLGPQRIPSPPGAVAVIVADREHADDVPQIRKGRVTRLANVTAFCAAWLVPQVRSAVSALRWGTRGAPEPKSIVLGRSIDRVRLDEPRAEVEKTLGPGHSTKRGVVSYFGGHLLVDYWFHDGLYDRVEYVETRWSGYRTRSGVRVGLGREALRRLYVTCTKLNCLLLAGPTPDPAGTEFWLQNGKVVDITIGRFG